MTWATMKKAREFFKSYAIYNQRKNNGRRLRLKCRDPACEWWIFASILKNGHTVRQRKYNNHHTSESYGQNLNKHAKTPVVLVALEVFLGHIHTAVPRCCMMSTSHSLVLIFQIGLLRMPNSIHLKE